jgi:tRNA G18 (ribose-2'-O)-methylase SpoU
MHGTVRKPQWQGSLRQKQQVKARCPHLDCCAEFEVPDGTRYVQCSACARAVNARDVKHFEHVQKQFERLSADPSKTSFCGASPLGLTVLLEDIRSLWNVGSIFRTADGAGFDHIYLCGITGTPPRKEIAKTSLGAEDVIPWQFERSALHILPELKKQGVTIVGLERTKDSVPLTEVLNNGSVQAPLCLILGNEVTGISFEALEQCDYVVELPMRGMKESLNVAVAFGIAAYIIADAVPTRRRMDASVGTDSARCRL